MNNVEHPDHYTAGPIHDRCGEVVEAITVTQHHNFNVGNAIKYLWRRGLKHHDVLEDLAKARQYIDFEIDRVKYAQARNEDATTETTVPIDVSVPLDRISPLPEWLRPSNTLAVNLETIRLAEKYNRVLDAYKRSHTTRGVAFPRGSRLAHARAALRKALEAVGWTLADEGTQDATLCGLPVARLTPATRDGDRDAMVYGVPVGRTVDNPEVK